MVVGWSGRGVDEWLSVLEAVESSLQPTSGKAPVLLLPEPHRSDEEAAAYFVLISNVSQPRPEALSDQFPWVMVAVSNDASLPADLRIRAWQKLVKLPKVWMHLNDSDWRRARETLDEVVKTINRPRPDLYREVVAEAGAKVIRDNPTLWGRALHQEIRRQVKRVLFADKPNSKDVDIYDYSKRNRKRGLGGSLSAPEPFSRRTYAVFERIPDWSSSIERELDLMFEERMELEPSPEWEEYLESKRIKVKKSSEKIVRATITPEELAALRKRLSGNGPLTPTERKRVERGSKKLYEVAQELKIVGGRDKPIDVARRFISYMDS